MPMFPTITLRLEALVTGPASDMMPYNSADWVEATNSPEGSVVNIAPVTFSNVGVLDALLSYTVVAYKDGTRVGASGVLPLLVLNYSVLARQVTINAGEVTIVPDAPPEE